MKKRILTLVCLITCIFGLTACGSETEMSEHQQEKLEYAAQYAPALVDLFANGLCQDSTLPLEDYTTEEVEYAIAQTYGIEVDGYAVLTGIESYKSALKSMGMVTSIGDAEIKIDGKQIVVEVDVQGLNKNAKAEVILSNDMFMTLKSTSLNPISSAGELMSKAGLNTMIGMGTVFCVLILISLIISCFQFIPKIQTALAKSKEAKKAAKENNGIDNAVAQITAREEVAEETDDLELIAVIAAAIAASEGATSTDGFVVRSIRRR